MILNELESPSISDDDKDDFGRLLVVLCADHGEIGGTSLSRFSSAVVTWCLFSSLSWMLTSFNRVTNASFRRNALPGSDHVYIERRGVKSHELS